MRYFVETLRLLNRAGGEMSSAFSYTLNLNFDNWGIIYGNKGGGGTIY